MIRILLTLFLLSLGTLTACKERSVDRSFVDDRPGLLTVAERDRIANYHRRLFEDLDIHLQVVILAERAGDIDAAAASLFEAYRIGGETRGARGVLLLIDPQGGQARLEIGYDLEPVFTDLFVGRIERQQMVPFFQAGRVGAGVEATFEMLVAQALRGTAGAGAAAGMGLPHLSGGGGAKTPVAIGAGVPARAPAAAPERFAAGATPLATLRTYIEVLHGRVKDPDLALYTPETREFFRRWMVTDGQQEQELRTLSAVLPQAEERIGEALAVVRFPAEVRQSAPYLLRRSDDGWQLDFTAMSRLVGFNHLNQWYFRDRNHPWMFAFADWEFDGNGFPRPGPR